MSALRVLLLPGWLDSGPGHWQTVWEASLGWQRVVQADWHWPRRGDWMARLEEVLLESDTPTVLAAHSLGCHLVAAWAQHSSHSARVRGALLVAPPNTESATTPPQLHNWRPMVRVTLPFPCVVLYSSNDPFADPDVARSLAADWGAEARDMGPRGHLNADSGLGDWPAAQALLHGLAAHEAR